MGVSPVMQTMLVQRRGWGVAFATVQVVCMIGAVALPWIILREQPSVEFELVPFWKVVFIEVLLAWISAFLIWARRNLGARPSEYDGLALLLFILVAGLLGCAWPVLALATLSIGVVNVASITKICKRPTA